MRPTAVCGGEDDGGSDGGRKAGGGGGRGRVGDRGRVVCRVLGSRGGREEEQRGEAHGHSDTEMVSENSEKEDAWMGTTSVRRGRPGM